MRAEHLKGWLAEAQKEEAATAKSRAAEGTAEAIRVPGVEDMEGKRETETEGMTHWGKVVALVREEFGEGRLAEESMWQAVVLIPKGKGEYRGIGLVEVMWKVVTAILNRRITASITYHEILYGFRASCSTVTATIKAKLIQQLVAMREEVLYVIFLDLHKEYYALDRDRCLEILEG